MNSLARPWIGIVFKCLSALGVIFAIVFFMRMQEEQSDVERYRSQGTVSKAVVTDKQLDKMVMERRAGRSRSTDIQIVSVRYDPNSKVKYADYSASVAAADLPVAPPVTGDPMKDSTYLGNIWVSKKVYDSTDLGDTLVVVDTPFSGDDPEFIEEIKDWDAAVFYPRIAIALALAFAFGLIGWRIGKVRR